MWQLTPTVDRRNSRMYHSVYVSSLLQYAILISDLWSNKPTWQPFFHFLFELSIQTFENSLITIRIRTFIEDLTNDRTIVSENTIERNDNFPFHDVPQRRPEVIPFRWKIDRKRTSNDLPPARAGIQMTLTWKNYNGRRSWNLFRSWWVSSKIDWKHPHLHPPIHGAKC